MMPNVQLEHFLGFVYGVKPPLPQGFMPLWAFGVSFDEVPCLADRHMPESGIFLVDPFRDGRKVLVAHPRAWAANGARNLAAAYRPDRPETP